MFTEIYQGLRKSFQENWFKFLFKYTALAKLLIQNEIPSAWVFFRIYLSSWWWNRLWFRSLIQNREHLVQFDAIVRALEVLEMSGILTEKNYNKVATHADPYSLLVAFFDLQESEILNQVNFDRVIANASPWLLALGLPVLQEAGILNEETRALVAAHLNSWSLFFAIFSLQQAGILNQANFTALLASNHANLVSEKAIRLIWEKIPSQFLTQENFQILLTAAEHDPNPMAELERVVNQIRGINLAPALDLPDVSASEAALVASVGHQACLDEQEGIQGLSQHSIWDNRDSSADARRSFDKQYGLVLRP